MDDSRHWQRREALHRAWRVSQDRASVFARFYVASGPGRECVRESCALRSGRKRRRHDGPLDALGPDQREFARSPSRLASGPGLVAGIYRGGWVRVEQPDPLWVSKYETSI